MSRSVVITGGNRGIGRALAEAFLANGDQVAVTTRAGGAPEGALDLRCDITRTDEVEQAFAAAEEAHGKVEVVVANAGITADTLLLRMDEEDFSRVLDTNLTGAFRVAKRATRSMLRQRRGRIILISSVTATLGSAGQVNYASSKAGLIGMARSLTRELGGRQITTNVIAPGFIETDMTAALPTEQQEDYRRQIPLGRFGAPEEVASTALWLASEQAGYVTGAVIPVDGGLGMGH